MRGLARMARLPGWLLLGLLLWPLASALWLSLTPGETLAMPTTELSLRWYRDVLVQPRWTAALVRSLGIAAASSALATVAGFGLALALEALPRRWRGPATLLALLPLFAPPVTLAMALLPLARWAGSRGVGAAGLLTASHALLGMPLVLLTVRAALADADPALADAARAMGARPWQVAAWMLWPLTRGALFAGAALAFVVSLNEFVIALFIADASAETLPKVVWPSLRYTLSPRVAAASGLSLLATVAALGLTVALRRVEALTRFGSATQAARAASDPGEGES